MIVPTTYPSFIKATRVSCQDALTYFGFLVFCFYFQYQLLCHGCLLLGHHPLDVNTNSTAGSSTFMEGWRFWGQKERADGEEEMQAQSLWVRAGISAIQGSLTAWEKEQGEILAGTLHFQARESRHNAKYSTLLFKLGRVCLGLPFLLGLKKRRLDCLESKPSFRDQGLSPHCTFSGA